MSSSGFLPAVLAVALTAAATARAADLPFADAPPPAPAADIAEVASGWYLRGDVGYTDYVRPREDKSGGVAGAPLRNLSLAETASFGGGVGYRVNPWLRFDVTADYRPDVRFRDRSSRTNFVEGFNEERGKFAATTAFANAYVDLGTWHGFTPYVGAGVGLADYSLGRFYSETTCITTTCGDPSATHAIGPQNDKLFRNRRTATQFAWAVMAGTAFDLGSGLALDVGYRYVDLGDVRSGYDTYGFTTKLKSIEAHEVRAGLRWMFATSDVLPRVIPARY